MLDFSLLLSPFRVQAGKAAYGIGALGLEETSEAIQPTLHILPKEKSRPGDTKGLARGFELVSSDSKPVLSPL